MTTSPFRSWILDPDTDEFFDRNRRHYSDDESDGISEYTSEFADYFDEPEDFEDFDGDEW